MIAINYIFMKKKQQFPIELTVQSELKNKKTIFSGPLIKVRDKKYIMKQLYDVSLNLIQLKSLTLHKVRFSSTNTETTSENNSAATELIELNDEALQEVDEEAIAVSSDASKAHFIKSVGKNICRQKVLTQIFVTKSSEKSSLSLSPDFKPIKYAVLNLK